MNGLVYLSPNTEEPFTTSEVIAECAGVKRDTVQKLVQRHEKDLREFGMPLCVARIFIFLFTKLYHRTYEQCYLSIVEYK